jgi:hypothetical protein
MYAQLWTAGMSAQWIYGYKHLGRFQNAENWTPSVLSCWTHDQMAQISTTVLSEALGLTRTEELTSRKHFNPLSGQFFLEWNIIVTTLEKLNATDFQDYVFLSNW